MKELSIEQKAKRYDEAIKRLEDIMAGKCQKTFVFTNGLFDYIFPELKESEKSEDERIRNAIINVFASHKDYEVFFGASVEDILAWLEKLGEQKPANTDFSDLKTWKYIVEAVWTEKDDVGLYFDSPFTEEVAKKLQKRFGNIEQKPNLNVEIPFGANDSELEDVTYYIPKGYHAEIEDNKVVIKKDKQKLAKCLFSNDTYTDEERKVLCDGCKVECELKKLRDE